MIVVVPGWLDPHLVETVQRFRGAIYLADGAVRALPDGRHIETADAASYHIVSIRNGLDACIRYRHFPHRDARIGGWAVAPEARGSRIGIQLALECVRLAELLGDDVGVATATVRHGSADILRRLGGRVLARYYDAAFACEMERIEFRLGEMRRERNLRRAA